ncbi:MAG: 30S ribosomal protein S2 [Candidatus Staskawiczbacteria bacterium RIFOXYD2_FULL_37_9]|uniref:Small ribosomal subunit protein uS2 n=1 Tax=Candidatus Staskawiczbacteria bacterium RIFOXYB1_FULL_37_44 TaxID=1802223 RepID=A0A1G2IX49_9BACT|nr:MAG: 30S ribosomal protein S2 [Candidatus Staskawiczbacteria bacterium RIFOXYB1_FULL_37_44]OGZ83470.1 MAG: 30S ribosomal protein S2 [Candidatus Staskawiczbacteria bacterium RIFOXYC1_FULL_37_52]OGZ88480.1 MAG: 30S ribosomal protein S2 [Candidatus Staskawiczbacteria bacterium RIFOXYC2_FULL_37_19]OGZ90192.1 MAG: 30S ribosomal protein S2 [Candidatus Staskawiczbacteria bacterium RIFOXYD1_FULL_37_110]OGZ93218.1 MAG: 30S ribosomal protein S2 [Candidatus Staskawiczbacteria bacterium RIFOXYD2_FULL_37
MAKSTNLNVEEMAQAGVNFGHKVSKLHPKMKPYISGIKNNVNIFDLEKTANELEKALAFVAKIVSEGKSIVFVGTKVQLKGIVQLAAVECGVPYVTERWLGGTFTNFETIQKRVSYFKDLEKKRETGELEKYTKRERLDFDREIAKLKTKFEGVRNMQKLPDAVLIFGLDKDITCAREAKRKGIKIISIVDSNVNPDIADYPIPANDDAILAVSYIINKVKETILDSKQTK